MADTVAVNTAVTNKVMKPSAAAPAAVESIHVAEASRLPMRAVDRVSAEADRGLVGDRYHGAMFRQVTVQATGELAAAARDAQINIDPGRTRRNITISAAAVPRAVGHRWRIGAVELEVARDAAPCRLMEETFGEGARTSLRGRAGVACRVLTSGTIRVGNAVDFAGFEPAALDDRAS